MRLKRVAGAEKRVVSGTATVIRSARSGLFRVREERRSKMQKDNVTTTAGETFTHEQHCELAYLIWVRWGRDFDDAASAWRRLFQNSCPDSSYKEMVENQCVTMKAKKKKVSRR